MTDMVFISAICFFITLSWFLIYMWGKVLLLLNNISHFTGNVVGKIGKAFYKKDKGVD